MHNRHNRLELARGFFLSEESGNPRTKDIAPWDCQIPVRIEPTQSTSSFQFPWESDDSKLRIVGILLDGT